MDIQTVQPTNWLVYRQDYHGLKFLVAYGFDTEAEADEHIEESFPDPLITGHEHKQWYETLEYPMPGLSAFLAKEGIIDTRR